MDLSMGGREMEQNSRNRRTTRIQNYDYSQPGMYFVTLCVRGKECVLGEINNQRMSLSPEGQIAVDSWKWLENKFPVITLDTFCIMPNHTHTIIQIHGRGALQSAPIRDGKPLGQFVGAFKTHSTVLIIRFRNTPREKSWQRNYYEHIIRNERSLDRIRKYIKYNHIKWEQDVENPNN
jgi:putative transposase